jgi:hypothetical protein
MSLHDIPIASCMWHVHGVDMDFAEEGYGVINGGWKPDFGGLMDLALVTCLNILLYIGVKCGPPEAVEKGAACGVETLMAELVVGIMDERVLNGGVGVELVLAMVLLPPKASPSDEETVCSANEMGQHVGR